MSYTIEKLEKSTAKLTIEVSAEDFDKAVDKAYNKNKNRLTIPGFRKGKAPRKLIEKTYGVGVFYEDAANFAINDEYNKVADECDIEIVSRPEIDVVQIEPGKPFIFTATVGVMPEITLGKYKGVEIEMADTTLTDEEVEDEIKKVREQNSRTVSVTDRAVQMDDQTVIDFEGFVDGEAFEGGKGENYPLTIGSHSFIDTFEDQLVGKNIGEEVEVNVTFPEEYHAENLAGKDAMFKVTVKEIKVKELPELDDDFVQDVSDSASTVDEYKEEIKKNLSEKKADEARKANEQKALEQVVADTQMEISDLMINSEAERIVNDFAQRLQSQGLSIEQYLQYSGSSLDQFKESTAKPEAETRIKNSLVLEAIAKAENIEATDEEYDAEIKKMADMYQMDAEKIKEAIAANENDNNQIKNDIAVRKALEFIADNAVAK